MKSVFVSVLAFVVGCGGAVTSAPEGEQETPPGEEEALPGEEKVGVEEEIGARDPACVDCLLRCTTEPEAGESDVLRVFVRPGDGEEGVSVEIERGPLHDERRSEAEADERLIVAGGEGQAWLERGKFTSDASRLTAARVELGDVELEVHITYSWIELVGELSLGGEKRSVVCWDPAALAKKPTYDAEAGHCFSGEGMGTPFTVAFVRETKNGECGAPMHADLHEGDFGGPVLRGWNLRGARLTTGLFFADLLDADLRGADLSDFTYGYARITGRVDAHTILPAEGCVVSGDFATCEW